MRNDDLDGLVGMNGLKYVVIENNSTASAIEDLYERIKVRRYLKKSRCSIGH
ncbi:hypothetical protein ACQYAD_18280 [Neobacillus sp. SM06]|uniref:hypothetical protein n=1 Tax=Neobacillus sp. SM06 TaxID=3422492 RepID=UPI003D2D4019